jgi:hypothetical protein
LITFFTKHTSDVGMHKTCANVRLAMNVASLEEVSMCVKCGERRERKDKIGVGKMGS